MPRAQIVIGLAHGDEGKGSWVDHLVRRDSVQYVVRFNGGAQASHNVVSPDDIHHGFAQFAAASLVGNVHTILSRFMLVEPAAMLKEASALSEKGLWKPLDRVQISERAPLITPFNQLLNRIQETWRAGSRHGSCGMGIGLTQEDVETLGDEALYVCDLSSNMLKEKLHALHERKLVAAQEYENEHTQALIEELANVDIDYYLQLYRYFIAQVKVLSDAAFSTLLRTEDTVFEGAQGVLLDQQYGFFPHCSRSNCTFENAQLLLDEAAFEGEVSKVGLLRAYGTRHGAGPFVTEDNSIAVESCHNRENLWQGTFRHGWFDAVSARYALEVVGSLDVLAITNLDRMQGLEEIKYASRYDTVDADYFHDASRMRVLRKDIRTLAGRCDVLGNAIPVYETMPGFGTSAKGTQDYLERLEAELQHPIAAYSDSVKHRKVYR